MPSTPRSSADGGFSLIELLVAVSIALMALGTTVAFFSAARYRIQDQIMRLETLQALRASIDTMVRDLRLGGACLPITGDFITLDGVNSTTDQITTRTGLVRANETCVRTVLAADIDASDTQLPVQTAAGFTPGMRVYIRAANGTTGETFTITGVNTSSNPNTLSKATTLSQSYLNTSGVYAIDERTYSIDSTRYPNLPVLDIAVNGSVPTPFAFGIENLQLQYELARNCASANGCDVVDLPANDTEFALVNEIFITVTARSRTTGRDGQYYRVTRTVTAKPRNLLPG